MNLVYAKTHRDSWQTGGPKFVQAPLSSTREESLNSSATDGLRVDPFPILYSRNLSREEQTSSQTLKPVDATGLTAFFLSDDTPHNYLLCCSAQCGARRRLRSIVFTHTECCYNSPHVWFDNSTEPHCGFCFWECTLAPSRLQIMRIWFYLFSVVFA